MTHYDTVFDPCCALRDRKLFSFLSVGFPCLSSFCGFHSKHFTKMLSPDFYCCHLVILGFPSWQMLTFVNKVPRITQSPRFGKCFSLKVEDLVYESWRGSQGQVRKLDLSGGRSEHPSAVSPHAAQFTARAVAAD